MATSERVSEATVSGRRLAENPDAGPRRTLIAEGPWDHYDLESLLPLKEVVQESREFGFLLRHYWIPATELRFRQSSRTTDPDGNVEWEELQIDRQMARCRSNECTWRETVRGVSSGNGSSAASDSATKSEVLCSYDCYKQTYVSAEPVRFELPVGDQAEAARRQALHRLPILVPPGPVPIGFSWHGKVGESVTCFPPASFCEVGMSWELW